MMFCRLSLMIMRLFIGAHACSLISKAGSQIFVGDAVLTTGYLNNRTPSRVLRGPDTYSVLFPDRPLYSLPSNVFECTCFVQALDPGRDKPETGP